MRAVRAERLTANVPKGYRVCWRCGVEYLWANMRLVERAPCLDCRKTLKKEGDKTDWVDRSTKASRAAQAEENLTE